MAKAVYLKGQSTTVQMLDHNGEWVHIGYATPVKIEGQPHKYEMHIKIDRILLPRRRKSLLDLPLLVFDGDVEEDWKR